MKWVANVQTKLEPIAQQFKQRHYELLNGVFSKANDTLSLEVKNYKFAYYFGVRARKVAEDSLKEAGCTDITHFETDVNTFVFQQRQLHKNQLLELRFVYKYTNIECTSSWIFSIVVAGCVLAFFNLPLLFSISITVCSILVYLFITFAY